MAGADSLLADRRLVIAVLGVVVVLPLCFPRDLGALAWVSAAAVRPVAVVQRCSRGVAGMCLLVHYYLLVLYLPVV